MRNADVELGRGWLAVIAVCSLVLGMLAGVAVFPQLLQRLTPAERVTGVASVGGPFKLMSHRGEVVSNLSLRGRPVLLTFGTTTDADVTAAMLQVMSDALIGLGRDLDAVSLVLITLDPEVDTPAVLAAFLQNHNPRVQGLTGSPDQIAAVAKAFRTPFVRVPNSTVGSGNLPTYYPLVFVINVTGNYVSHLGVEATPEELIHRLRKLL
jgi:protein SCO1